MGVTPGPTQAQGPLARHIERPCRPTAEGIVTSRMHTIAAQCMLAPVTNLAREEPKYTVNQRRTQVPQHSDAAAGRAQTAIMVQESIKQVLIALKNAGRRGSGRRSHVAVPQHTRCSTARHIARSAPRSQPNTHTKTPHPQQIHYAHITHVSRQSTGLRRS